MSNGDTFNVGTAGIAGGETEPGVYGNSPTGIGVYGTSSQGYGVEGFSETGAGVAGLAREGFGVLGIAVETGLAGFFQGDVDIQGFVRIEGPGAHVATILDAGTVTANTVTAITVNADTVTAGTVTPNTVTANTVNADTVSASSLSASTVSASIKAFRIDHPLNPKNKFLVHASVESSEMKTFYDGVVTLDRSGKATVRLPKWFEALNKDFRYQLTPVGAPGPNLHIAEGVTRNRFQIAGGAPSMKVCWQVTGIRQDKFAKDHPLSVEQDKRTVEQDKRTVEQDKRREDVRHAQSPRQVEAFNRRLKEVQAKTEALMSAHSQRMEELRKAVQKKK